MPVEAKQLGSGVAVITLSGRLTLGADTADLDAAVDSLLEKNEKKLVLDLTALEYADSSGIGMLISCLTKVHKSGGELKVAGANPRLRRIFSMTGVASLLPMFDTLADATA